MNLSLRFKLLRLKKILKSCEQKVNYYKTISKTLLKIIDDEFIEEVINDNENTYMYVSLLNYDIFFTNLINSINSIKLEISNPYFKKLSTSKNLSTEDNQNLIDSTEIMWKTSLNISSSLKEHGKEFEETFIDLL